MKLTKGEFCQFNLKSKIMMLKDNGMILMKRKIGEAHEIRLFLIYDFYVEVCFDVRKNKILRAEPILNTNWIDLYNK